MVIGSGNCLFRGCSNYKQKLLFWGLFFFVCFLLYFLTVVLFRFFFVFSLFKFKISMMDIYSRIEPILFDSTDEFSKSLILFDPKDIYSRININPTLRRQSLSMGECFPNNKKEFCACGCGVKLPKRATRWADPKHAELLAYVMKIIAGDTGLIRRAMQCYLPLCCAKCGKEDYEVVKYCETQTGHKYINFSASGIHVDHIVSVKNGGGGCWLGNYQFLCHTCNLAKEQTDRLLRLKQPNMPISTLFT